MSHLLLFPAGLGSLVPDGFGTRGIEDMEERYGRELIRIVIRPISIRDTIYLVIRGTPAYPSEYSGLPAETDTCRDEVYCDGSCREVEWPTELSRRERRAIRKSSATEPLP